MREAWAATLPPNRSLSIYNVNTGERLSAEYSVGGEYLRDALRAIDHMLRDYRTGDVKPIDPVLLDVLHTLRRELGSDAPLHLVSGYRSPSTNERLRRSGHGVALKSYHLEGKAADVYLPDRQLADLRWAARKLGAGGVGYYPGGRNGFVHVDTGPVRYW
jgi:uncharacterized protein YcbK (DUF882 family)